MDSDTIHNFFYFFLLLKVITGQYLSFRNRRHLENNRHAVPDKFNDKISLEEHQKAINYSLEKSRFAIITSVFHLIILIFWIEYGLNSLDLYLRDFQFSEIQTGLLYVVIYSMIGMILGIPESLYSVFVIEEKYGFNNMTLKLFVIDFFKGLILGMILGLPLLTILLWAMIKLGTFWWVAGLFIVIGFQFLMILIFPTIIAPLFNKFTPLEEGELKDKILNLAKRVDFDCSGLFVMDASKRSGHGNAYFTGLGKSKRIVFFDTLLKGLTPNEAEAVLAHELGHFKHGHIKKGLILSVLMTAISFFILGKLYTYQNFYIGHGVENMSSYMALLLFSIVMPIYTFFFTPIQNFFSRKHEYEADGFAAKHSNAIELINALVKLYKENAGPITIDPLYAAYYYSHPEAFSRVKNLESLS